MQNTLVLATLVQQARTEGRLFQFIWGIGGPVLRSFELWRPRFYSTEGLRLSCWLEESCQKPLSLSSSVTYFGSTLLERSLMFYIDDWRDCRDMLLWAAVDSGCTRAVEFFLAAGADVLFMDMQGGCIFSYVLLFEDKLLIVLCSFLLSQGSVVWTWR